MCWVVFFKDEKNLTGSLQGDVDILLLRGWAVPFSALIKLKKADPFNLGSSLSRRTNRMWRKVGCVTSEVCL